MQDLKICSIALEKLQNLNICIRAKGSRMIDKDCALPAKCVGRFGVVKLWPELKTAEDECIARLKLAAQMLGVECVEIHPDGSFFSSPQEKVSKQNVDFVIHLHYDTPKYYDAFSFVALWNPLKFYHGWGYSRCSRNLTTHDDFLSCSSVAADDHVARMVRKSMTHIPAHFNLYHSTADIIYPPSVGDGKLFYIGINWEAVNGGKARHQEVLKCLDRTGLLNIYGPQNFQGVRVWKGYRCYVKEVPFDGISVVEEISKASAALVLSSQAHRESRLMSSRLFEAIAAGTVVICDENYFAKKYFGDSLLYIDSRASVEQIVSDVTRHLGWVQTHQEQALDMVVKAQDIFRQQFSLVRNLSDIYNGLSERKQQLIARQNPPGLPSVSVRLNLLMPEFSEDVLKAHIESVCAQEYRNFSAVLVVDAHAAGVHRLEIEAALATSSVPISLVEVNYFEYGLHAQIASARNLGEIILELLDESRAFDAFMVVAPNERLFSNHITVLAGALQRELSVNCAATAIILSNGSDVIHSVCDLIDFENFSGCHPVGFGRFIFRIRAISKDIKCALPYTTSRPLAVLVEDNIIDQQYPASIIIDTKQVFPAPPFDVAAENEVLRDYGPGALKLLIGFGPHPHANHSAHTPMTKLALIRLMFNAHWVIGQLQALRKQGLRVRLQVFKREMGL